jgi:D-beta-D-heptose 7-phosphate kinase/D-beta-D-heptose 1-phosphate adenosyltransferase
MIYLGINPMTLSIPDFRQARVLVVGDVMLDRYWFGPTGRISPEAPVPVVRVNEREDRPGGAANVAVNLASVGVQTTVVGLVGSDDEAAELSGLLEAKGIRCEFEAVDGAPTITKLRVLSRNQQLIRLDFENRFSNECAAALVKRVEQLLDQVDLVICSDYDKGALQQVQAIIRKCRKRRVKVLVDPKGSDFSRYAGATAITPNLSEFEAVVGTCSDDDCLVREASSLRRGLELEHMVVTRSERGMSVISSDGIAHHLPAEAREVFDVTGAGDTVIAMLGAGLAAGLDMEGAARLANLAAGIVVRKIGVGTVTVSELRLALHQQGKGGRAVPEREQLILFVREAQARGERVVMTNGCFDILHRGHVAYLEEAKALGNRLIVAVNDDASVRKLKGQGRPVNNLDDRMAVLGGLAAVDWVVPFSEDTPESLICDVLPDVLVKGGDYKPEQIAGARCVLDNGGEVKVLSFLEGRSTSSIIDAIRKP